jgi:hypothetical protein
MPDIAYCATTDLIVVQLPNYIDWANDTISSVRTCSKLVAVCSSDTLINMYETTRRHSPNGTASSDNERALKGALLRSFWDKMRGKEVLESPTQAGTIWEFRVGLKRAVIFIATRTATTNTT